MTESKYGPYATAVGEPSGSHFRRFTPEALEQQAGMAGGPASGFVADFLALAPVDQDVIVTGLRRKVYEGDVEAMKLYAAVMARAAKKENDND